VPRPYFIARNYAPSRAKDEIDLNGFDGDTLVFVEVRTRAKEESKIALPELSITPEKHHVLVRTAHYFLRERHIKECPLRFDVWPSTIRQANRRLCGCTKRRLGAAQEQLHS
jgi:Holliday junction resolvase-like predicted endonuclease